MSNDSTTLRVPKEPTHRAIEEFATRRNMSIKDATTFLIEQGLRWNDAQEEVYDGDE